MKNRFATIIYFIVSIAFFLHLLYDSRQYLRIDPTLYFLSASIPLILLSYVHIYIVLMDEKEKLFKTIVSCLIGIGCITLFYEIVKPNYTYVEAQEIVEREYKVEVIESFLTTSIQIETGKEVYSIKAIQDSKKISLVFNPYTKEIIILK
ncbi:hypothetical protein [Psychrobacillus sp. FSL K6-2843]|uniref:hypothetical protein n=1 Tax=Psychrobacillus sp. FSL K6-2843 TaxID=2921549 RepID=UPI00315B102D